MFAPAPLHSARLTLRSLSFGLVIAGCSAEPQDELPGEMAGSSTGTPDGASSEGGEGDGSSGESEDSGGPDEGSDDDSMPTGPICGDGEVEGDELCDDGEFNGAYGGCAVNCRGLAPHCGDGDKDSVEACDDFNNDNGDGCSAECQLTGTVQWTRGVAVADGSPVLVKLLGLNDGVAAGATYEDTDGEFSVLHRFAADGDLLHGTELDDSNLPTRVLDLAVVDPAFVDKSPGALMRTVADESTTHFMGLNLEGSANTNAIYEGRFSYLATGPGRARAVVTGVGEGATDAIVAYDNPDSPSDDWSVVAGASGLRGRGIIIDPVWGDPLVALYNDSAGHVRVNRYAVQDGELLATVVLQLDKQHTRPVAIAGDGQGGVVIVGTLGLSGDDSFVQRLSPTLQEAESLVVSGERWTHATVDVNGHVIVAGEGSTQVVDLLRAYRFDDAEVKPIIDRVELDHRVQALATDEDANIYTATVSPLELHKLAG